MIRLVVASLGFVAITGALLWALTMPPAAEINSETVTRADPAPFDLSPATAQSEPAPRPAAPEIIAAPVENVPTEPTNAIASLRDLSYGMLGDAPVANAPAATTAPAPVVAAPAPQPVIAAAPQEPEILSRYEVQQGDSLPGIAFRHYGTTAAYPQILNANKDVLTRPGDLTAGMILTIPKIQ